MTPKLNYGYGDHCYGNQLLPQRVRIHAAPEAAHEMHEQPAALLAQLTSTDLGPVLTPFIQKCFGPFDFEGITVSEPNTLVQGSATVSLGDRRVELVTLGSAHTHGDVVARTVSSQTPRARPIAALDAPSAPASTIRARSTSRCSPLTRPARARSNPLPITENNPMTA
jgi:hypothetical protein